MFTITNPGKRPQKVALKLRSNPGQEKLGNPIQGASTTPCQSYAPNGTAIAQPTTMATTGPHCCNLGGANSLSTIRMVRAVPARMGAAAGGTPSGESESLLSTTVMMVDASNIRTVPATTGVMTRRSQESREMNANWINADATIRLDSNAGPARDQRGNTDGDEGGCSAHVQGIARTESPESNGLQDRTYSANHEDREEDPGTDNPAIVRQQQQ